MPNGAAFDDAVQLASQTPNLGVGIHFSLVGERCVALPEKLKGLVDSQGQLPASYSSFARGYLTRRFTIDEIRRELDAQLQRVLEAGIIPTHVDSHQHVHILPGVFAAVLESIKGTGIGVVRVPREELPGFRPTSRHLQLKVLTGLCRRANKQAHETGLLVVDHFWGLEVSGALNENALLEIIAKTRPGVNEIMSHPGDSDAALHQKYAWGYNWDDETKALQSLAVKQAIEARDIRLAHFGELLER